MIILSGCRSTKKVSETIEVGGGRSSDSTAVSLVLVDSTSWSSTNDSSMTSSTHYEVLRDSVGMPMLDSLGAPMVYIVQRDTVWRVVTIDKGASSTIIERDTVHVHDRDTVIVHKEYSSTFERKKGISFMLFFLCAVCFIIISVCKMRNSGS